MKVIYMILASLEQQKVKMPNKKQRSCEFIQQKKHFIQYSIFLFFITLFVCNFALKNENDAKGRIYSQQIETKL